MAVTAPDSFDSPDGRTYSAPETAGQAPTPGQADARAEQKCAEFTRWMEAQGNPAEDEFGEYGFSDMHEAFNAGMDAQAAIAAAAPAPDVTAGRLRKVRDAPSSLLDRTEGSNVLTDDERDEYRCVADAAAPAPAGEGAGVLVLGFESDEQLAEAVKAARAYDHDNRGKGNWGSVPERQVARLIIGALGELQRRGRAQLTQPQAAPELAAAMAESRRYREGIARFADRLEAEAAKDESARERQGDGVSRLLLQRTADLQRLIASDIRQLAGDPPPAALDLARAETAGIRAAAANTARELAELRERIADLAEQVTASAKATEPSRKSQIKHELAIELRKLLEDQ